MHEVVIVGDQVEVRGPIGGYFVWEASLRGPLLLIGGGSGAGFARGEKWVALVPPL